VNTDKMNKTCVKSLFTSTYSVAILSLMFFLGFLFRRSAVALFRCGIRRHAALMTDALFPHTKQRRAFRAVGHVVLFSSIVKVLLEKHARKPSTPSRVY
jgi:hypothetical protein